MNKRVTNDNLKYIVIIYGPWENLPYGNIEYFQRSEEFCIGQLKNSILVKKNALYNENTTCEQLYSIFKILKNYRPCKRCNCAGK